MFKHVFKLRIMLTDKQQKFIDLYDGNATRTATACGYVSPSTAGRRCLLNVQICAEIKRKREKEIAPLVANRQERQEFWTDMMRNPEEKSNDRMRASELLGKSEGDFLDRVENTGDVALTIKWDDGK